MASVRESIEVQGNYVIINLIACATADHNC